MGLKHPVVTTVVAALVLVSVLVWCGRQKAISARRSLARSATIVRTTGQGNAPVSPPDSAAARRSKPPYGSVPPRAASANPVASRPQLIVKGTVLLPDGSPATSATVQVFSSYFDDLETTYAATHIATSMSGSDGTFRIPCNMGLEYVVRT